MTQNVGAAMEIQADQLTESLYCVWYHRLLQAVNCSHSGELNLLDLSAAFDDMVNHSVLHLLLHISFILVMTGNWNCRMLFSSEETRTKDFQLSNTTHHRSITDRQTDSAISNNSWACYGHGLKPSPALHSHCPHDSMWLHCEYHPLKRQCCRPHRAHGVF